MNFVHCFWSCPTVEIAYCSVRRSLPKSWPDSHDPAIGRAEEITAADRSEAAQWAVSFNPRIDTINRMRKKIRPAFTGSPRNVMPKIIAPNVPMPTQTA